MKTAVPFVLALVVAFAVITAMRNTPAPTPGVFAAEAELNGALSASAESGKPVLAYFTADWCGPCQQFKRDTLANDRVAGVIDEKTIPVYIDIDENGTAASQYRVQGVPTTLLIRDGEVIARAVGYANPDDFIAFIEDNTVAAAEQSPQADPLTPAD